MDWLPPARPTLGMEAMTQACALTGNQTAVSRFTGRRSTTSHAALLSFSWTLGGPPTASSCPRSGVQPVLPPCSVCGSGGLRGGGWGPVRHGHPAPARSSLDAPKLPPPEHTSRLPLGPDRQGTRMPVGGTICARQPGAQPAPTWQVQGEPSWALGSGSPLGAEGGRGMGPAGPGAGQGALKSSAWASAWRPGGGGGLRGRGEGRLLQPCPRGPLRGQVWKALRGGE
uniref:Uncharacterized protein n=1 Tax=Pipistrellus kuhlii TaxID=59472 RepID=A0A7J7RVG0_PIPKU|nr:hypothetical protein mPipKuh1_010230 [Pipistrellus kuhlii]